MSRGKKAAVIQVDSSGIIKPVLFSPDGKTLATVRRGIDVWNVSTQTRVLTIRPGKIVHAIDFSPDGKRLASACSDGAVRVWDPATGTELYRLEGHAGVVSAVCFSRDGTRLASGGADSTLRVWDLGTRKEVFKFQASRSEIRSIAFSPQQTKLASGLDDGTALIWSLEPHARSNSIERDRTGETQETNSARVDRLIRDLEAESPETRDQAENALVRMGPSVRPRLLGAIRDASTETQGRLQSILHRFGVLAAEERALSILAKGHPFPATSQKECSLKPGMTVAEAVRVLANSFGVKIDYLSEDPSLQRDAETRALRPRNACRANRAEDLLFYAVTQELEVTYVVEGEQIYLTRLTPRILLERLRRTRQSYWKTEIDDRLAEFDGPHHPMATMGSFLQSRIILRDGRERWLKALAAAATDPGQPSELRAAAITGIMWFHGVEELLQPDATAVFLNVFRESKAPDIVRKEALGALAWTMDPDGRAAVLQILEEGAPADQQLLLARLTMRTGYLSATHAIGKEPEENARFMKTIERLQSSSEAGVSLGALALHMALTWREPSAELARKLARVPLPTNPLGRQVLFNALRRAAFHAAPHVWDRVDELAAHAEPSVRASAVYVYGRSAGGPNRGRDVRGSLRALRDPEPLVRYAAAYGLGVTYSRGAIEIFTEDASPSRREMERALEREVHPKVRAAIEGALKEM